MPTPSHRPSESPQVLGGWETAGLVVAGVVVVVGEAFLLAARLASALAGPGGFDAGLADAAGALARLPSDLGDPAAAWGPKAAALPGPVASYACLAAVVVAAGVLAAAAARLWKAVAGPRHPLGVEPNAGLATARHLRRLLVRRAEPGRLTLGRVGGRLVAAEARASLAVVGPTGCGKSVGFAMPALLEWNGPVLATSVRPTWWRPPWSGAVSWARCGSTTRPVHVPHVGAQWSPVAACGSWAGAMRMSAWLCDAAKDRVDSVTNGDYWYTQARKNLAPHRRPTMARARPRSSMERAHRSICPRRAANSRGPGRRTRRSTGAGRWCRRR